MPYLVLKNNEIDTFYAYNLTLKKFDDHLVKYKRVNFDCIKGFFRDNRHNGTMTQEELEYKSQKRLKEVRTSIVDLGYNNRDKFEYFITLTFDDRIVGEYSHDKAIECLTNWLNNQRHQNRGMYYILVPEFHKSGRLHFHGLVGNVPNWKFSKAINSKTGKPMKVNNTQIYNLDNYKLGFTTISKIKDKEKVVSYISKYATKELIDLKCKKRYWSSRNLTKPKVEYDYIDTDLVNYLMGKDVKYYDLFKTVNREIELCNIQLPIIDKEESIL